MDEHHYKVERQLAEVTPKAARPQKAGASFDLRLYFRQDDGDPVGRGSVSGHAVMVIRSSTTCL